MFAGELALAEHDWSRAAAIGGELARTARSQWLSALPAISAMVEVVRATAELGRAASAHDRAAAVRAGEHARGLYRRGRTSFYAATALRIWGQAESLQGHTARARSILDDARRAANTRGGKIDQLALAALAGARIEPGMLASAVTWSTGGVVT